MGSGKAHVFNMRIKVLLSHFWQHLRFEKSIEMNNSLVKGLVHFDVWSWEKIFIWSYEVFHCHFVLGEQESVGDPKKWTAWPDQSISWTEIWQSTAIAACFDRYWQFKGVRNNQMGKSKSLTTEPQNRELSRRSHNPEDDELHAAMEGAQL